MANDSDWVADVRRWYFSRQQATATAAAPGVVEDDEAAALGYEAAHPALQSRHWPDAPSSAFTDLS